MAHKRIEKVSCGAFHTLALSDDQELFTFGSGAYGECGTGDNSNLLLPKKLEIPKHKSGATAKNDKLMKELLNEKDNKLKSFTEEASRIIDIAAGGKHSMVLTGAGLLYTFGFGDQGQLGHRDTDNQKKPKLVDDFEGVRI